MLYKDALCHANAQKVWLYPGICSSMAYGAVWRECLGTHFTLPHLWHTGVCFLIFQWCSDTLNWHKWIKPVETWHIGTIWVEISCKEGNACVAQAAQLRYVFHWHFTFTKTIKLQQRSGTMPSNQKCIKCRWLVHICLMPPFAAGNIDSDLSVFSMLKMKICLL